MTDYKLTYFDLKGRAEPIRYILSYMGKKFEDDRIPVYKWSQIKDSCPFGKVPVLQIDGQKFHQSAAICRYLAIEAGLAGKTLLENFEIDQIVGDIDDLIIEVDKTRAEDPVLQDKLKNTFTNETLPFYFQRFDKIIENNNGYLVNGKLSWADLYMAAISESLKSCLRMPKIFENYPHLKGLIEKVHLQPGIQQWNKKT
uniref:glutathione transferase n=1 Tax=Riptortus pedestris TaxID=329032 RepID=R4WNQ3_RIPPE|nr:glutathionetransferase [Riptortus pedestris]